MRSNPEGPYLPHHPHLYHAHRQHQLRQKSLTASPFPPPSDSLHNHLPATQNLEFTKHDHHKPKILFNYSPSTPKFAEEDTHSLKAASSPPKSSITPQLHTVQMSESPKPASQPQQSQKTPPKPANETLQFAKPVLVQRKPNTSHPQKRKEVKSKTLNNKYETIAEVMPTLEDSRNQKTQRDEQMIALKRELNATRSQNNQLRTEVLRWEHKYEQSQQLSRKREQDLLQEVKELKIELQKAHNQRLLAQVSEAELEKKIKRMMQEAEEQRIEKDREKLKENEREKEKAREEHKVQSLRGQRERVYALNGNEGYLQLF